MVKDTKVATHDLVLKDRTWWNVDSVTVISYNDDSSTKLNVGAKSDVSSYSKVV